MFKAALFDLDGTLQDSEIVWVNATRDFVRDNGYPMTDAEALRTVYGRSWTNMYRDIIGFVPSLASMTTFVMADRVRDYYTRLTTGQDISIPGSVALFKRLSKTMQVAIVSGSPRLDIANAVRDLGLTDYISFYIGAEEYGEGKPDPACYLMGAKRAGVEPSECVVFEDAAVGILAAKRAGMHAIALTIPGRPEQDLSAADEILTDLSQWQER
jgi:beta-phosphoglucomutase